MKLTLFARERGTSQQRSLVRQDFHSLLMRRWWDAQKRLWSEAGTLLFTVEAHLSLIAQLAGGFTQLTTMVSMATLCYSRETARDTNPISFTNN